VPEIIPAVLAFALDSIQVTAWRKSLLFLRASALISNRKAIPNALVFAGAASPDKDSRAGSYDKPHYRQKDQPMSNLT
jgi:uncharacterized protein YqcC (DUF446 family)